MKLGITLGKWRCSMEYGVITVSPEGIVERSKTICEINSDVSFDYTGGEAMANMRAIAELPTLIKLALQNLVYHQRKSNLHPDYEVSTKELRTELKTSLANLLNVDVMLLSEWVDQLAGIEDLPINEIKFLDHG